ncbi:FCD domain-containing protein [Streptomyces sp. NPDC048290]|uniref:GntR family transcriptional regulator n=1 Tax=Streptomyces sp. NPDC048290 TaxID=3155811 RepID=UPI003419774A
MAERANRPGEGTGTRTDGLYDVLRADILGGRLTPGSRLKFPELVARYGTSVGAAREVLARLAGEGLVRNQPRKGFTVTPLSHADLLELTQARAEMESLVLRLSIREGDMRFEADAVAAHHLLERTPLLDPADPSHPTDAWVAAHAAFHQALLAGCGNRRLRETALALRDEAELYRAWSVAFGGAPRRDVTAEHRQLLEYTVARDEGRACELLRTHISHTANVLITCATDEPPMAPPAA